MGDKFQALVADLQYEPRLWCLRRSKLLLIAPGEDKSRLVAFNFAVGAATRLQFSLPITDIVETATDIYIASGSGLYRLDEAQLDDAGEPITYSLRTRDTISSNYLLVCGVDTEFTGEAGTVRLSLDSLGIDMPANRRRKVLCNHSTPRLRLSLESTAPFQISHIMLDTANI